MEINWDLIVRLVGGIGGAGIMLRIVDAYITRNSNAVSDDVRLSERLSVELDRVLERHTRQIAALEAQNERLARDFHELEAKYHAEIRLRDNRIEELERENAILQRELDQMRARLDALEGKTT